MSTIEADRSAMDLAALFAFTKEGTGARGMFFGPREVTGADEARLSGPGGSADPGRSQGHPVRFQ